MLAELERIEKLKAQAHDLVSVEVLDTIRDGSEAFPVYGITIGTKNKSAPSLGLFAGIHGLEKVGSEVTLSFVESINEELKWDRDLRKLFESVRIASIPIINPTGMARGWRANMNGIDLMRNAPVEALEPVPFLVGGHRYGPQLPYFRGKENAPMEKEIQTVIDFVKREMFESKHSLSMDFHSGFGGQDRLWYPYAKTKTFFPNAKEAIRIKSVFQKTFPHHVYQIEPQSDSYITHGDVWDYLYDLRRKENKSSIYIPWTLEMGSWIWLKKNPSHIFSLKGIFDPIKPHRRSRMMRRHLILIHFFLKIASNYEVWA